MSGANDRPDGVDVDRLLAGAAAAIRSVRFCWLTTVSEDGFASTRPMGRLPNDPAESRDDWTVQFITDGRSRKAADMRRTGRATVIFQNDPGLAFVALIGRATLFESEPEVRKRWQDGYNALFAGEAERANAAFVEVDAERLELWIRGVTPEPFGMHTTTLERDAADGWRAVSQ